MKIQKAIFLATSLLLFPISAAFAQTQLCPQPKGNDIFLGANYLPNVSSDPGQTTAQTGVVFCLYRSSGSVETSGSPFIDHTQDFENAHPALETSGSYASEQGSYWVNVPNSQRQDDNQLHCPGINAVAPGAVTPDMCPFELNEGDDSYY